MHHRISVILITYNREKFVRQNFPKLYNLLNKDDELIIIDNNSKDNTEKFLKEIKYDNVRKIFIQQQGLNICRNVALAEAKFNNLVYIDDDAYPDNDWLESFRNNIEDQSNIAIYAGKTINEYETIRPEYLSHKYDYLFGAKDYGDNKFFLNKLQSPGGGNMMINKAIIKRLGGFNERFDRKGTCLLSNGETELVTKIFDNNFKIIYIPTAKIYHWIGVNRLTKNWLIRRMYWQGISDGFLAKQNRTFLVLCIRRFFSHFLKMPLEILLNIKNPRIFIFNIILETVKTFGILKSLTLNIENV